MSDPALPKKGSRWRHKSGRLYVVNMCLNQRSLADTDPERAAEYPIIVHYNLLGHGASDWEHYGRTLEQWLKEFELVPEPA